MCLASSRVTGNQSTRGVRNQGATLCVYLTVRSIGPSYRESRGGACGNDSAHTCLDHRIQNVKRALGSILMGTDKLHALASGKLAYPDSPL